MCVCVQMAPVVEFTKMKSVPKEGLDAFCTPMKALGSDSLGFMELCYPDVMKKVKEMCSGSEGDGQDATDDNDEGERQQQSDVQT